MTLNPVCESVETAQGVPLTVTGVAQVKIMKNADLLQTASEQFLGKKEHEIKSTVLQTLEGHLRAILGMSIIVQRISKIGRESCRQICIYMTQELVSGLVGLTSDVNTVVRY